MTLAISNSGTAQSWTQQQVVNVASYTWITIWTAIASVGQSMTVTVTRNADPGGTDLFGCNALTFRGSDGVGASAKTNVSSGAPSLALTTVAANSAIIAINGDWNAADGTTRTWRTINSITPTAGNGLEVTYFRNAAQWTIYGAYWNDAGAAGSKTTGISAPSTMKYSIVAVEVKGAAGAATRGLFMPPNLTTGAGGSFFSNPVT